MAPGGQALPSPRAGSGRASACRDRLAAPGSVPDLAPDLASLDAYDLGPDPATGLEHDVTSGVTPETYLMPHRDALIGSVAQSSAACPASGWWRCDDRDALDGTRWFAAGSCLPRASFGQRVRRHSSWTLVRLASEP